MKNTKRLVVAVISFIVLITVSAVANMPVKAYFTDSSGLYRYTLDDNEDATITKYLSNASSMNVPSEIDGYTVVAIGNGAFSSKNFTTVVIPDTVTSVGSRAFDSCTKLKTVTLSSNLEYLGGRAFASTAIESVKIPKTLVSVGANGSYRYEFNGTVYDYLYTGPFFKCENLKTVTFESGITQIPDNLFRAAVGIEKIVIPNTVASIGDYAFQNCFRLTDITVSNSVKSIGSYAFDYCCSLDNITLSKNLEYLGGRAFSETAITSVEIPKSLKIAGSSDIQSYTFNGTEYKNLSVGPFFNCKKLQTVTFEKGTTQIVENLFRVAASLEKIVIPDTVTSIGNYAFQSCFSLSDVTLSDSVESIGEYTFDCCYELKNIALPEKLEYLGGRAFAETAISAVEIPASLEKVGTCNEESYIADSVTYTSVFVGPFFKCDDLKSVTFASGITKIPDNLFRTVGALESITIPDTVTHIGNYAFQNCFKLSEADISDSVISIGDYAFDCCYELKNITLSEKLEYLGGRAFAETAISAIEIPKTLSDAGVCHMETYKFNRIEYGSLSVGPFFKCENLKTVVFVPGTTKIPQNLFRGAVGLESIVIPDTVTVIETSAFENCFRLDGITIPNTVKNIFQSVFENCVSLRSIEIHGDLSWGSSCFYGCTSLKDLTIEESVINVIPDRAFGNCTSLKTVRIPDSCEMIMPEAFIGCTSLETVQFGEASILSEICNKAFSGCKSLKEVILPETTAELYNNAFTDCTSLTKIVIPQSTKAIGNYTFSGCVNLSDVQMADYSVIIIGIESFSNCSDLIDLNLPKGLKRIEQGAFSGCTKLEKLEIPESVSSIDPTALISPDKTVIYGKTASYAENFANRYGFTFVNNNIPSEAISPSSETVSVNIDEGDSHRAEFTLYSSDSNDVVTLTTDSDCVIISGHDIYADKGGTALITATSSSGAVCTFSVTVRALDDIFVATPPEKTVYLIGEAPDLTGLSVNVMYSDGTSDEIDGYIVSGFDSSTKGICTLKIQWVCKKVNRLFTTYYDVSIVDMIVEMTGIKVSTMPSKVEYQLGETLDLTGLSIAEVYNDGSEIPVDPLNYTVSGFDGTVEGVQILTVTYGEFTTEFTVSVNKPEVVPVSLSIAQMPTVSEYIIGDALNTEGLILCLSYSDGTTKEIIAGFDVTGFDSSSKGIRIVTVSYNGFTVSFEVAVYAVPGDATGDNKVNIADVTALLKLIAKWDISIDTDAVDVNNDGKINIGDVTLILKYIAKWDVELK